MLSSVHVTELSPSLGIPWPSLGVFSQVGSSRYLLCAIGRMPSESQAQRDSGERNREARSKVGAMSSNGKSFHFKKKKKAIRGFPGHSVVKNPPANARDTGSILSRGRSHKLQSSQAHEPQLLSLCSTAGEDTAMRGSGAATKSSPRSPQLEKSPSSNKDPAQPKMNE